VKHTVEHLRSVLRRPRSLWRGGFQTQIRMHEVLRIAAAAGITLVVIGLSILFFEWVFY
jgi:hypothetical protein